LPNADFRLMRKCDPVKIPSIVPVLNPKFEIRNPKSFHYLMRPSQHTGWNRQTDLLRRLLIDHQTW